jgi:hypothetical protein
MKEGKSDFAEPGWPGLLRKAKACELGLQWLHHCLDLRLLPRIRFHAPECEVLAVPERGEEDYESWDWGLSWGERNSMMMTEIETELVHVWEPSDDVCSHKRSDAMDPTGTAM